MDQTETLEHQANQYNPSTDKVFALRDLKHGEGLIRTGEELPADGIEPDRVRTLIRVKYAKVVFGAKGVTLARVPEPAREELTAEAAPSPAEKKQKGFSCDVCKRVFATKLALGSHKKAHKG